MKLAVILPVLLPVVLATPAFFRESSPTVTIKSPEATIVGKNDRRLNILKDDIEKFHGIPFAKAPTGERRLKPPEALTDPLGQYDATEDKALCPQFVFSGELDNDIPTSFQAALGELGETRLFQNITNQSEDCLYLNIQRPAGTKPGEKLPVLFWIFGGGFQLGWNNMYDGTSWVKDSIDQDKRIIFVSVNYRVGGFGFMPGKEILDDSASNLGLLDQRLGLKWVSDNIEAFGGDPTKVTIWGESAGAISVFDQMAMYDGDNMYNGKPLFQGAIMNSGSIVPADPVDCPKGQAVYDSVVREAGCSNDPDTLECLRKVDYDTFLQAANLVPSIFSYTSVALSYLPRPDGAVLTASPDRLVSEGHYAKVPFIIGDQEDEGTLFALFQRNITQTDQLVHYIKDNLLHGATVEQIQGLVDLYESIEEYGSPFRTKDSINNWYPEFKRLAAILGDLTFTLTRRAFLEMASQVNPDILSWSYLSTYNHGLPFLGTFHASDILQVFFGVGDDHPRSAFRSYYLNFVNTLDPNNGSSDLLHWPAWKLNRDLINMDEDKSTILRDDFRSEHMDYIRANIESFYIKH